MRAFLLILILYPFAEVTALIVLANYISTGGVMLYILLSALLGIWMLRHQKLATLQTIRHTVHRENRIPAYAMLWPVRYALAGLLLILPGVINELAALLLLLPLRGPKITVKPPPSTMTDDFIEGEYCHVDKSDSQKSTEPLPKP